MGSKLSVLRNVGGATGAVALRAKFLEAGASWKKEVGIKETHWNFNFVWLRKVAEELIGRWLLKWKTNFFSYSRFNLKSTRNKNVYNLWNMLWPHIEKTSNDILIAKHWALRSVNQLVNKRGKYCPILQIKSTSIYWKENGRRREGKVWRQSDR